MKRLAVWVAGTAFLSCGTLDMSADQGPAAEFSAMRRVFANDSAANDSLPAALARDGVKFVLQPGKNYGLRMETTVLSDRIGLYLFENGALKNWGSYSPLDDGGAELFQLRSDRLRADFFVAVLQGGNTDSAASRLRRVRLFPLNQAESARLDVRLVLVRSLSAYPDAGSKVAFAESFLRNLDTLFAAYGVTLNSSYELVETASPPVSVAFGGVYVPLPGRRMSGHVHLYVVDNITAGVGLGSILGFAPREALDLSSDPESRVVLNGRMSESLLVTTAAHELGHFFGLRHSTATDLDMSDDGDLSNRDDGFSSTPPCSVLSKVSAPSVSGGGKPAEGPRYCLYQSVAACPASCDLPNLMFAYDCAVGPGGQRRLSGEQSGFLRRNIALFQP